VKRFTSRPSLMRHTPAVHAVTRALQVSCNNCRLSITVESLQLLRNLQRVACNKLHTKPRHYYLKRRVEDWPISL